MRGPMFATILTLHLIPVLCVILFRIKYEPAKKGRVVSV